VKKACLKHCQLIIWLYIETLNYEILKIKITSKKIQSCNWLMINNFDSNMFHPCLSLYSPHRLYFCFLLWFCLNSPHSLFSFQNVHKIIILNFLCFYLHFFDLLIFFIYPSFFSIDFHNSLCCGWFNSKLFSYLLRKNNFYWEIFLFLTCLIDLYLWEHTFSIISFLILLFVVW